MSGHDISFDCLNKLFNGKLKRALFREEERNLEKEEQGEPEDELAIPNEANVIGDRANPCRCREIVAWTLVGVLASAAVVFLILYLK